MNRCWWKEAVVYQIYPISFMDSNGDGIGDIPGIIKKLDYLKDLGVTVVWLSPVYKSPNDDNGYDISDYCDIMEQFGTLEDWDMMLKGLHERGIRLIMDLVANHTSDEHPWFVESRSSRDSAKRDYYIWRDPKEDGSLPNDWESCFSGPAWEYDEKTGQYYMHIFSRKQPDLNWDNPVVREEIYSMMRFWLDRGIDGFRLDAISHLSKYPGLPDAKESIKKGFFPYANGPRLHEFLKEMNREVLSKYDCMTCGETGFISIEETKQFANLDNSELNMIFQFDFQHGDWTNMSKWVPKKWDIVEFKENLSQWQKELDGIAWNSIFIENHDIPRPVSRYGDDSDEWRELSAKVICTLDFTLQGTVFVYQGEELGMTNVPFKSIDEIKDIESVNYWKQIVAEGKVDLDEAFKGIAYVTRDNARTPMQWDDTENAGFTTGKPWIKVNPNYTKINAKQEMEDQNSVYNYYKRMIQVRKDNPLLVYGHYEVYYEDSKDLYVYTRYLDDQFALIILNFTNKECDFKVPEEITKDVEGSKLLISNYNDATDEIPTKIRPYEALVFIK